MVPDARDERIAELEGRVAELEDQLRAALARIAELQEKLGKSSRNSGKPPSSDTPAQKAERKKKAAAITKPKPGQRRPGGQPGHRKFVRKLVPDVEVDRHHDCIPEQCECCAARLRGRDASPRLHQVFHLPEVRPTVEQYALHALACPDATCGHVSRGKLPAGVPTGQFGPSVSATVMLLMGLCRLGKRTVQEIMADLFGLEMSLGAVIGCQQLGSSALAVPVEQAREHVRRAPLKYSDETSWREGPKRAKAWLWTVVTSSVTVFAIQRGRSIAEAKTLLGKFGGVLVSDRYSAYGFWRLWMRQVCWSHLIRDFIAIAERGGESARIGDALLNEARQLFVWWHRVRDGTFSRNTFRLYVRPLERRVRVLLNDGTRCAHSKTAKTCAKILTVFPALWLFVEKRGIEPTNNIAERTVRHGVLWRKISGGTHSQLGSRFVERILTVIATLRQQDRNILAFFRDACTAQLNRSKAPSLLPAPVTKRSLPRAA